MPLRLPQAPSRPPLDLGHLMPLAVPERVDIHPERPLAELPLYEKMGWLPHDGQRAVIEAAERNRVVAAGRRFGKSEIGGHKLVQEALNTRLVKTRLEDLGKRREYWIVGPSYCVDEETECLTRRGWLRYDQLREGDWALGQNSQTGLAEWTLVEKVSVFEARPREMVHSRFRGHESLTTLDHRWLVRWGKPGVPYSTNRGPGRPGGGAGLNGEAAGWRFVTSQDLFKSNEKVYAAAPVVNLPTGAKYTDSFVELVAWYWTEGCLHEPSGYVSISQNPGLNMMRIQAACTSLFGPEKASLRSGSVPGWRVEFSDQSVGINGTASAELRSVCPGVEKVVTPEFLVSLTQAQLDLFIFASIRGDADSDWEPGTGAELGQKSEARSDAFQMACQLAGLHTVKKVGKNDYGPYFTVSVYGSGKNLRWSGESYAANSTRVTHLGRVWCPTTGTGTWLARRNGQVFFTGNTDSEKEFRVLWNELSRAGLREYFDKPGSYNNPEQGDLHLSLWGGRFQCHAKSEKHPESLVGEGLSGVILAEAAKLKERTWNKLIRPTLADFNGWSLMTSTPEGKNWFYEMWKRGQDPTRPDWNSWRMPSWMNPYVYPGGASDQSIQELRRAMADGGVMDLDLYKRCMVDPEIAALVGDLTEESFNQEIGALFTEFVGRVFKGFDEELHVGDFTFDRSWKTYGAVDYGFTNPSVWLLIQVDPFAEHVRVIDEVYEAGLTINEFADLVKERGLAPDGMLGFYPDPASPGDTRILSETLKVHAKGGTGGELRWRIDAIRGALKERNTHLPEGHEQRVPSVMFDRKCVRSIADMLNYRYPERRSQVDGNVPESPMKKDDHAPEALGRFYAGHFGTPDRIARRARVRKSTLS